MKKLISGTVLVLAAVLAPTGAWAGTLLYDLRVTGVTGTGATLLNNKSVQLQPNATLATVTMDIIAMIPDGDGNFANDFLQSGYLSFLTAGVLPGDMRNTITPLTPGASRSAPFNAGGSSGTPRDADGDGDIDIGAVQYNAAGSFFYNFLSGTDPHAWSTYGAATGKTVTGYSDVKVGTLRVKFTPGIGDGGKSALIQVLPRVDPATGLHYWSSDASYAGTPGDEFDPPVFTAEANNLNPGNGVGSGTDVLVQVAGVPEPGTLVLLALGGLALVPLFQRWRRKSLA